MTANDEYRENGRTPDIYREQGQKFFIPFLFQSGNCSMPFRLEFPGTLTPGRKYPLVLFLHGAGSVGTDNILPLYMGEMYASHPKSVRGRAFILIPQCPSDVPWTEHGDSWSGDGFVYRDQPTSPMSVLLELLDYLLTAFPVDRSRLAVGGCSMGGYGTWDILSRRPGLFRAAFPICGCGDPARIPDYAGTALWFFHGARDSVVLPDCSRRMQAALKQARYPFQYTEFPDVGHDAWNPALALDGLHEWLAGMLD